MKYDFLIVGCGFSGSVLARKFAEENFKILIIDQRDHIGGNAYDYEDSSIMIHKYGPHIFNTNSEDIWNFLSRFTEWYEYEHKVLAYVDGKHVPIPINMNTINKLYGKNFTTEKQVQEFYDGVKQDIKIRNSKDSIVSKVGPELYEKFFKNYTKKQWDLWPEELDPEVCGKIPVRTNRDDRYFTSRYQAIPKEGYAKMFENMLNHKNIVLKLNCDFFKERENFEFDKLIYTGLADRFYNYRFGKLPYRSLDFKLEKHGRNFFQETATVNYPNTEEFTRITEFKYFQKDKPNDETIIVKEFPKKEGDPYYPVPNKEAKAIFKKYEELMKAEKNTFFVGRLAQYKYFNMDQCVGAALLKFRQIMEKQDS